MPALRRFALLAALVAGCGSSEGGPAPTIDGGMQPAGSGATIRFVLAANGDVGALPATAAGVSVESVAFWIDNLSISGDRGGYDYGNQGFDGMLLDLTNAPVSFDVPNAAPALYSRMRVDFRESGDHAAAVFQGMALSYRVAGKTAAGQPFVLAGGDNFSLDLRAVDGAELSARTKLLCVVRFDMTAWWNGVNLTGTGDTHHSDGDQPGSAFLANVTGSASMTLSAVPR